MRKGGGIFHYWQPHRGGTTRSVLVHGKCMPGPEPGPRTPYPTCNNTKLTVAGLLDVELPLVAGVLGPADMDLLAE